MVVVEPKVKLLLGRPLLSKLKPKELQKMGTQYQGLFDENDVSSKYDLIKRRLEVLLKPSHIYRPKTFIIYFYAVIEKF